MNSSFSVTSLQVTTSRIIHELKLIKHPVTKFSLANVLKDSQNSKLYPRAPSMSSQCSDILLELNAGTSKESSESQTKKKFTMSELT